jgi:alkanesulfonate monooxygenase SsuD/methylene tetrahydromethanopterin reductase-like flavin-dependent oxidoreductase (luciferase family)
MPIPLGFCLGTFGTTYTQLREAAHLIDQLGFDSVWLWDHYVSWDSPSESVLDGLTTLAGLAEATQQVKLGPLVANNTNRHPARLAKIAATLQDVSGGRFQLGLGAGGLEFEQAAFGIIQGDNSERFGRLREAVQIIPALWRGTPVTFAGQYYQLQKAYCSPAPQPTPALILGAIGPGVAKLAGRYANGVNLHWQSRARLPELLAAVDAGLAASGRTRAGFDISIHPPISALADDPQGTLHAWQQLGFTRAIAYITPPFPLNTIEQLAAQLQQTT